MDSFLIPLDTIKNKSTLNLCEKYSMYKVYIND